MAYCVACGKDFDPHEATRAQANENGTVCCSIECAQYKPPSTQDIRIMIYEAFVEGYVAGGEDWQGAQHQIAWENSEARKDYNRLRKRRIEIEQV